MARASTAVNAERDRLEDAFNVHQALVVAENAMPWLRDNPQWRLLRFDAFETFHNLMEGRADGK